MPVSAARTQRTVLGTPTALESDAASDNAFAALKSFSDSPGGLVFEIAGDGEEARIAFTFQNPLIVADVLRFVWKGGK